ncbi:MAG TPA: uroporphyrinogen-III C-methyltransferase [Thermodesulfobacteriota bacterium]
MSNIKNTNGIVYLIGAGPGDPGLFTIKGQEYLAKANIIIYDYLVNPSILNYAQPEAEIIYAGKQTGSKEMSQEEINLLLVDKAKSGKIVARLKGGDPFIFGRGGEEAEILFDHAIPFEIVPGITSASAVPAYAGIPLTHRDFNSSFAVVTGHEDPSKNESNLPWAALANIGTVVLLMGVGKIEESMKQLIESGKSPNTPAALITWGTLPKQRTVTGTIGNLGKLAKEKDIRPPAIIVVGEVVNLRNKLNWFESKPLFGKKILVTRARKQASYFVKLLEEQGAETIEIPMIEIAPPRSYKQVDRAIDNLSRYNWIIFTSVNGVEFFFNKFKEARKNIIEFKGINIATIGEKTAKAIENYGLTADIIPKDFKAEGLIESFRKINIKAKKILIPRAKDARETLPAELRKMGAKVDVIIVYETKKPNTDEIRQIKKMLNQGAIDVITFTSSSTVKNFFSTVGKEKKLLSKSIFACIGPITAKTLSELGIEPQIICKKYTIEELAREIIGYFKKCGSKESSTVDQKNL